MLNLAYIFPTTIKNLRVYLLPTANTKASDKSQRKEPSRHKNIWVVQTFFLDTTNFQGNQKIFQDTFFNKISLYIYYKRQAVYDHELISHDQHDKHQVFQWS